jgi:hypothetical protein
MKSAIELHIYTGTKKNKFGVFKISVICIDVLGILYVKYEFE